MLQRVDVLASADVPDLDCEVARRGGEDVFGSGVEEDLSNLSNRGGLVFAGEDRFYQATHLE